MKIKPVLKGPIGNKYYFFKDYPDFKPNLSPREVFVLGSFGGTYYRDIKSSVCNKKFIGIDVISEFPKSWWKDIDINDKVTNSKYDKNKNRYGVKCGTSLEFWESKGWINKNDCYGWFQWYCRFFMGRRLGEEDIRQIGRWKGICSSKGRFRNWLINDIIKKSGGINGIEDYKISPVKRQVLQHWGYRLTKGDIKKRMKELQER